jgi:hypothetical protein
VRAIEKCRGWDGWENMRMRTHTHEEPRSKPRRYWTVVVQINDDVLPRRHPDLPNVEVRTSVVEPGPALDRHWKRVRERLPDNYGDIRYDLMPKRSTTDREKSMKQHRAIVERLSNRGYTVNRDTRVWSVYVIELDPHEAPSFRGYLYVGMTSKAPEIRVEEHRMGQRTGPRRTHSLKAHRHFVRRRTDLEPKRKYFSLESALRAESATRIVLEAKGFKVIGGTERLPKE